MICATATMRDAATITLALVIFEHRTEHFQKMKNYFQSTELDSAL